MLENIDDGREVIVKFINGDCFGLCDFEMVDESIYQRTDLCVADIVRKVNVSHDVYKVGNKLEFSVNDIIEIEDEERQKVLYKK